MSCSLQNTISQGKRKRRSEALLDRLFPNRLNAMRQTRDKSFASTYTFFSLFLYNLFDFPSLQSRHFVYLTT